MPTNLIYDSVEKINSYWDKFKPGTSPAPSYIDKWLAQREFFEAISLQCRVCITIWDVVTNRFVYAVDKTQVLGNNASHFTEPNGVDYSILHFPREYQQSNLLAQLEVLEYCKQHPEFVPFKIVINMDSLYNTDLGTIHILQQASIIEANEERQPLLFLSYLYNISNLKKEPSAGLVLTSPNDVLIWKYNFEKSKLESVKPFSRIQKSILDLLSIGYHTKQIAEKLKLSPFTVNTHRRNMLLKTCCVDTTALVTYCRMVGLI